jgi:hypothetical protein
MGMADESQTRYMRIWQMEFDTVHRYMSLEKAINLFKKGFVSEFQLRTKLANMRYAQQDTDLLIQDAKNDILLAQLKQAFLVNKQLTKEANQNAKQLEKDAVKSVKSIEKQASDIAKEAKKITANQQKAYTNANIKAFFKGGFLDDNQVRVILTARGWTPPVIDAWMEINLK